MRSNAHINRVRSLRLVKKAWDGFMKIGSNNASYQGTGDNGRTFRYLRIKEFT